MYTYTRNSVPSGRRFVRTRATPPRLCAYDFEGMARQTIRHGSSVDFATPAEVLAIVQGAITSRNVSRVRAPANIALDANGNGQDEVYPCPVGMEFVVRRVTLDLSSATDPSTGNVPLNVAGKYVQYLRSGTPIEYGVPASPNAAPQVPGVQTWGSEQGPYLRNGEVFEVKVVGLTAAAILRVTVEGILYEHRKHGRG